MAAISIRNRHLGWDATGGTKRDGTMQAEHATDASDVAVMRSTRKQRRLNRAQSLADQLSDY